MADFITNAVANLYVNGAPAMNEINKLQRKLTELQQKKNNAVAVGDRGEVRKLTREIIKTEKALDLCRQRVKDTRAALLNLDKATPKQLKSALVSLREQLEHVKKGTRQYDLIINKIRQINAELKKIDYTRMQRIGKFFYDMGNAITFAIGMVTSLIYTVRQAVNAFAEMDEAMANTRKYTGMSVQEVERLNESFKALDTRTSRDKLNALAQEAGRMGINTRDAVQGYVEAADIINVALVDLGEGATQTIAKLTSIFGVKETMGIKNAMLSVGSAVNVLSQNCTASKPYLVEFAQRLGGIGAQARMTIPEILAFGATLDANGQKVEMSASAITRMLLKLFQQPKQIAAQVGLDVENFVNTLNKNTTQGLIMFLERLHQIGSKDALAALSPLFKDLGMDGIRMAQVMASLADNIDMVKWEIGEANKAFTEATSATREYNIFNNTAKAGIEKAKKAFSEMTIELGEKLAPVMRHAVTSGSALMRVLKYVVEWIEKNIGTIKTLTAALVAYKVAVAASWVATKWHAFWLGVYNTVATISRALTLSLSVAYYRLSGNIARAEAAQRLLNNTASLNPWGVILASIVAVGVALKNLTGATNEFVKSVEKQINSSKTLSAETLKEEDTLRQLFSQLKYGLKGTNEYKSAKDTIIKQYGKYISGLINEKGEIINLKEAYDRLTESIRRSARERGIAQAKEQITSEYYKTLADKQQQLREAMTAWNKREEKGLTKEQIDRVIIELTDAVEYGKNVSKETREIALQFDKFSLAKIRNTINTNSVFSWIAKTVGLETEDPKNGWTSILPSNVFSEMAENKTAKDDALKSLDHQLEELNPYAKRTTEELISMKNVLDERLESNKGDKSKVLIPADYFPDSANVNSRSWGSDGNGIRGSKYFDLAYNALINEIAYRGGNTSKGKVSLEDEESGDSSYKSGPSKAELKEQKKREKEAQAAAKRAAQKAKEEFKKEKEELKAEWELADAENTALRIKGEKGYREWLETKAELYTKYLQDYKALYEKWELADDEDYAEAEKKLQEHLLKQKELQIKFAVKDIEHEYKENQLWLRNESADRNSPYKLHGDELRQMEFRIGYEMEYMRKMQNLYEENSEKWIEWENKIVEAEEKNKLELRKYYEQQYENWLKQYSYLSAEERYDREQKILASLLQAKLISEEQYDLELEKLMLKRDEELMPEKWRDDKTEKKLREQRMQIELQELELAHNAKLMSEEEYEKAKLRIQEKYRDESQKKARETDSQYMNMLLDMYNGWKSLVENIKDGGADLLGAIEKASSSTFAVINAGFSMATDLAKANAEYEIAVTEKKYEKLSAQAEGNAYVTKKLEQKKEKEIQAIRKKASKADFAQKLLQAIAQTAQNALLAYKAGLQLGGLAGLIMAPIAAAMATAAGAVQIAVIKKQKDTAEISGYESGGFTRKGRSDEVAGVVHAGEWVASQKLLASPVARPMIDMLDYAQRTNTIGSLRMQDVSKSITANRVIAESNKGGELSTAMLANAAAIQKYTETMEKLNKRLKEPFVTINTVSGDYGIKQAQDDYQRLMNNKTYKANRI